MAAPISAAMAGGIGANGGDAKPPRLMSLDVLRGFDMFFIFYGAALIVAVARMFGADDGCWLLRQMTHVEWEGLHQHDTIFPLFLFLAGVSWPFSLAGQLARGRTSLQIHLKVLRRSATLLLIGLLLNGLLVNPASMKFTCVLGFIGVCWGAAAILFMHVRSPRLRLATPVVLLLGFWLVIAVGGGGYDPENNVIFRLNRLLMPGRAGGAESYFSLPTGAALAFMGMLAGTLLRREDLSGTAKTLRLLRAAAVAFALMLVFVYVFRMPVIKRLWTSSFILAAATYSFALLALFYWVIDVKGWRRGLTFFRVIGTNSILAYLIMMMNLCGPIKSRLFAWLGNAVPACLAPSLGQFGYLFSAWIVLYFLYRHKVFLRV